MRWYTWLKRELLFYACREVDRLELLRQKNEIINERAAPRVSKIDGLPQQKHYLPTSYIEYLVENKERALERIENKLTGMNQRVNRIERALNRLPGLHREVINLSYLSVEFTEDYSIAKHLDLSMKEFKYLKEDALDKLYWELKLNTGRANNIEKSDEKYNIALLLKPSFRCNSNLKIAAL